MKSGVRFVRGVRYFRSPRRKTNTFFAFFGVVLVSRRGRRILGQRENEGFWRFFGVSGCYHGSYQSTSRSAGARFWSVLGTYQGSYPSILSTIQGCFWSLSRFISLDFEVGWGTIWARFGSLSRFISLDFGVDLRLLVVLQQAFKPHSRLDKTSLLWGMRVENGRF